MRRPVGDFYVNTCLLAPPSFPDILSPLPLPERFPERRVGGPVFRKIFRRKVAFYVPFNIHRDCIHSIFRATCAEEGIICLHRSIEIYGFVFLAIIDGWMEFWTHGHSKSLRKELANHRE